MQAESAPANNLMLSLMDYNDDYETLGLKGSYGTTGSELRERCGITLGYYKFYVGEGGLRSSYNRWRAAKLIRPQQHYRCF